MIGEELKEIVLRFDLTNRTFKNAKKEIDEFICENSGKTAVNGISSIDLISYVLDKISYNITDPGLDTERQCVEVQINYYIKNKYSGYYSALYDPDNAEIIDDYTVIDL